MSIDINLVSKVTPKGSRDVQLKKIRTLSFVILFLVAFSSLTIFLISFRFSVNYVKKQQNDLIKKLSVYDETTSKILLLNSRLSDISSILGQRRKYNQIAGGIVKDISSSVNMQSFQISDAGISIEVSSSSLLELNNFLNHMISLSKSKIVSSVILDSLSSESSVYKMKLKAN